MVSPTGSSGKGSNLSQVEKSKDERSYLVSVWSNGSWVDREGAVVFDGAVQPLGRFSQSVFNYETMKDLVMVYCDMGRPTIWYLPPNGNVIKDILLLKGEDDMGRMYKRQGDIEEITLYSMHSFDSLIWYKTPLMEKIRLFAVGDQFSKGRRKEVGIVIGKPRVDDANKVAKPPVSGKGKEKMYEDLPPLDDFLDMNDLRDYDLSESDESWNPSEDFDDDSDILQPLPKTCTSKAGKKKLPKQRTMVKQPNRDNDDYEEEVEEADVPGFGRSNYGTQNNQGDAANFVDVAGFGEDFSDSASDTITTPTRLHDLKDDASSREPFKRYKSHLGGHFELELGLRFDDADTFRKAIKLHAIRTGTSTKRSRNDADRIIVTCQKNCGFRVVAARMNRDTMFEIRKLQKNHSCDRAHYTKDIGKKWVCDNFVELVRAQPNLKPSAVASEIRRLLEFNVSKNVIHRGLRMAKEIILGDRTADFAMARDYAETLIMYNPGSTAVVHVDSSPIHLRPRFERMYVCLDACLRGFKNGCRSFIALDGCFLKGPDGGFMLCAVTVDANDQLFPIAYAWVEKENRESWRWFLEILADDVGTDRTLTIISDRQKGLIRAVEEVLPGSEHRFCVRHIHQNMKARSMGDAAVRTRLWSAACAYTERRHKWHMDMLKKINLKAWKYLTAIDTKHWCRFEFRQATKRDLLVNNIAESFNAMVLEAREMPVVSMMEWIRRKLMRDFEEKRNGVLEQGVIGRLILKKLRKIKSRISGCQVIYATEGEYEVDCGPHTRYKVLINRRYCSCMAWQISGLSCSHVIACLAHERKTKLAPYCDPVYHKEAYVRAYEGVIHAMSGREDWLRSDTLPVDPPLFKKRSGRPKKKRERSEFEDENGQSRLGRRCLVHYCSRCGKSGHNKRSCTTDPGLTETEVEQTGVEQTGEEQTEVEPAVQQPVVEPPAQPNIEMSSVQPECSRKKSTASKTTSKARRKLQIDEPIAVQEIQTDEQMTSHAIKSKGKGSTGKGKKVAPQAVPEEAEPQPAFEEAPHAVPNATEPQLAFGKAPHAEASMENGAEASMENDSTK